jgi:hypothetical protein
VTEQIEINYVIGHYWDNTNKIGSYMLYSREVHYGTLDDAKETLNYVKKKLPDNDWRIFQLVQVLS